MMKSVCLSILITGWLGVCPVIPAYCPKGAEHRHVGRRNIKYLTQDGLQLGGLEAGPTAPPSHARLVQEQQDATAQAPSSSSLPCPRGCSCSSSQTDILVECEGRFTTHFPVDQLPEGTTHLQIDPAQGLNTLTLGPTFRQLNRLQELRVIHSQIPNIGQRTLWGLAGLRTLNLSHNSISHLVDYNFDGLHSLKHLILDHNKIRSVTSAAFHHVPLLETLSLAENQLTDLATRIFYKLNALKILDLSGNNILVIDEEIFRDIRNLQEFRCRGCGLRSFRVVFSMRNLRALDLSLNYIDSMEQLEGHLIRNLQTLDLSENKLEFLEKLESPQLEKLNLEKNQIVGMAPFSLSQTKLKEINLSFNMLRNVSLPVGEESISGLVKLHVAGNQLGMEQLKSLLLKLRNLEHLDASYTGLVSVSGADLKNNLKLRFLNLSRNYLVNFDSGVVSLPQLEVLDLSDNFLSGLQENFFEAVEDSSTLRLVHLQGNPWSCDACHIEPLLRWLNSSLMYWGSCFPPSNPTCLRCNQPIPLRNTPVSSLSVTRLPNCTGEVDPPGYNSMTAAVTTWSQYTLVIVICTLALFTFLVMVLRYRHYGVYLTGEKDAESIEEILNNPITVLDRNQDSYVDLKYPSPI